MWTTCGTQAAWILGASWIHHRGNVKVGGDLWPGWPVLSDGLSDGAVFTLAPYSLVLTDPAAATVFTHAPQLLVLADAAAAAVFTLAPLSLVLADAAAAAEFTPVPPLLMLAKFVCSPVLVGCRGIGHQRRGLA